MKKAGVLLSIFIPGWILVAVEFDGNPLSVRMAAIAVLMSVLWMTEAIPLAATALLPLVLFPFFGISSGKIVAATYMNSTVFLLIGGFMIALAMERWKLHTRIALNIIAWFGNQPRRLMLGFMAATCFLSMWISNTATTLVMVPIAMALVARFEPDLSADQSRRIGVGLLLAIAYSASIGGMMTLVGTAPNLVFAQIYEISNPASSSVGFAQWMMVGVPIGFSMLTVTAFLLTLRYFRRIPFSNSLATVVIEERNRLGSISFEEKAVLTLFTITALLWVTRKGLVLGNLILPGWQHFIDPEQFIDDGTVAILMAFLLFLIPARDSKGRKTTLLDKDVFTQLPWGVVVLFGGGFALASGFVDSGLSEYLGLQLRGLGQASIIQMLLSVCVSMTFLTELTSNTATTQMILPILQSAAEAMSISPLWLMLPATLSASCAFMFPVATPPNAIVFGSGRIRVVDMVKTGLILNLSGVLVIICEVWLIAPLVFGIAR